MFRTRNFVALTLLAASWACAQPRRAAEAPPYRVDGDLVIFADGQRPTAVSVEAVRAAGDEQLSVTGRLVWDEDNTARVFPPVSGRVTSIRVDVGARIGAGQTLALLASPDFGQVQSDAARSAADLATADRALERTRQLFEHGAAARKELDQAESDRERARAEAERTRARLTLWSGQETPTATVDQSFSLKSPVAGVVVERAINPGQEVRSDTTTPLFVVSNPRTLWVLLDVTESDLPTVASGAALRIHSAAWPKRTFPGRLDVLAPALDQTTRTVRARGHVENSDGLLRSEMYVTVDAMKTAAGRRMVLPANAVIRDNRPFVFVEEAPGRYRRTPVTIGPEREGAVTVLSGVPDSSWLVTNGSLLLEAAWAEGHRS